MSQITSDASIHGEGFREAIIREELGGLRKRIAVRLGIRPHPGESTRVVRVTPRKRDNSTAVDWMLAEWTITHSDPKSFTW